MENNLNIDWDLFCSNQKYHQSIKDANKQLDSKYFEIIAQCPNLNSFVLVNLMDMLSRWSWCDTALIEINKIANRATHILITQDLFYKLLDRLIESNNKDKSEYSRYNNTRRGLYLINLLLGKSQCEPLNINNFIQYCKTNYQEIFLPKPKKQMFYSSYKECENKANEIPNPSELVQAICTKQIQTNPSQQILFDNLEYAIKLNLLEKFEPETQEEYRMLFKYQKKVNHNKKFPHDIQCLENACTIPDNDVVVASIIKKIQPNSQCLSNALVYPDNKVIRILLDKVTPTAQQVLDYLKLKQDRITEALVTKYVQELNG